MLDMDTIGRALDGYGLVFLEERFLFLQDDARLPGRRALGGKEEATY
jgi:hypothetical protein